jgi:carnitine-CoA ligase
MNRSTQSFPQLFAHRAETTPDRALFETVDGDFVNYGQLYNAVLRWSAGLEEIGVRKGDLVATMLDSSMSAFSCWLGINWVGAAEVPINPEYRGDMLVHGLNDCRAEVLVIEATLVHRIESLAGQLPHLRLIVAVGSNEPSLSPTCHTISASELLRSVEPQDRPAPLADDLAVVIYTSGTTGPSKGVLRSWWDVRATARNLLNGERPDSYEDGAYYQIWPTFHLSGKFGLVVPVDLGLRSVLRPRFSLSEFWHDIREHRVSHAALIFITPLLMQQPVRDDDAENPLQVAVMTPLIARFQDFADRFGVRILATWGMTEVGMPLGSPNPTKPGTCGRPLDGAHVRLVDPDGTEVPDGQPGEVLIRVERPQAAHGYLNQPEATARAWRDGWMHTGDLLVRDDDGDYFFVDRAKDALRRRGHNISSFEVEAAVNAHPAVVESACIGVPWDLAQQVDLRGESQVLQNVDDEEIKVFVVRVSGSALTEEELIEFLTPRMPRYMVPRYVSFAEELPKTPTMKVKKSELRMDTQHGTWDRDRAGVIVPR